ncbi:MAG: peptidoglycan-binding domain-containing protein, partial [Bacillota bacterium]|nr:peptidoglycan-binding domain-containing protein [Bacillota bacterium]
ISYGLIRGYVREDLVYSQTDEGRAGYILRDKAPIYSQASEGSTVLTTDTGAGTKGRIDRFKQGYYHLTAGGVTGYMQMKDVMLGSDYKEGVNMTILLKEMKGQDVSKLQQKLKSRGFYDGPVTGEFGELTQKGVREFQKAAKLPVDGIAGEKTLELVYGKNNITRTIAARVGVKGMVKLAEWDIVKNVITRGRTYKVIDVRTGLSWTERRMGGWWHCDSEPLTPADTAKLKKAYGGKWSWDRRAVWVVVGSRVYAASMNGMPHMGHSLNNNFPGHHCIHFLHSKVHETGRECSKHQNCVKDAYKRGK